MLVAYEPDRIGDVAERNADTTLGLQALGFATALADADGAAHRPALPDGVSGRFSCRMMSLSMYSRPSLRGSDADGEAISRPGRHHVVVAGVNGIGRTAATVPAIDQRVGGHPAGLRRIRQLPDDGGYHLLLILR